ncbi:MAG: N(4)-(beta-N-acetylglucosaminyl)-L-asparaginase [Thermomicrobiales bacterium]|nr:N(4)-(beta-N-acetylglucosaminyl)-L-asparaginase [Thermomicrobiales bacterium]MCO5224469.1 N(4)-(beta-N-acetylglucosaminyl)-L-asparaginase [Thermomicrobiales bacterium]
MQPIIITCHNGAFALPEAMDLLKNGGSAVDAVVLGCTLVEANPEDHSVGYSGLPNLLGRVELDASVMDGRGLRAGSIGALQGYQQAAQVAREVMNSLPHVLLGGDGPMRLAAEMGLEPTELLTPEAEAIWKSRLADADDRDASYLNRIKEMVNLAEDPQIAEKTGTGEPAHGTVNFIARDVNGDIATGVSTSGWAWKYPGRMGDSPVIGAGNYADNRWGAAACTGRGEMAQRCLTAHSVVTFMRFGMSLEQALVQGMLDLNALDDPYASEMNILAMDKDGFPGAASSNPEKKYAVMTAEMSEPDSRPRTYVELDILKR